MSRFENNISRIFVDLGGEDFLQQKPFERSEAIVKYLQSYVFSPEANGDNIDTGLVVIKPEAQPIKKLLMNMIEEVTGVKILRTLDTKYNLKSFMAIYGKSLRWQDPEIGITFPSLLVAGSIGTITAIQFRHNEISRYRKKKRDLSSKFNIDEFSAETDPQTLFKSMFVGTGKIQESTFRSLILPYLYILGFGSINTRMAESFDVTGELKQRSSAKNLRTFNGIHCPSTLTEVRQQSKIYFEQNQ